MIKIKPNSLAAKLFLRGGNTLGVSFFVLAPLVLWLVSLLRGYNYNFFGIEGNPGWIAFVWGIIWGIIITMKGVKYVDYYELATASCWGLLLESLSYGPVFIFPGIFQLYKDPSKRIEIQRSVAIITASLQSAVDQEDAQRYKDDQLSHRMVAVLPYNLWIKIRKEGGHIDLLQNVGSLAEAQRDIISTTSWALYHEGSKRVLPQTIDGRETIDSSLKNGVQTFCDETNTGLDIIKFQLLDPKIPNSLQKAMQEIAKLDFQKEGKIIKAEGTKEATIRIAEGEEIRLKLEGKGKAWARRFFLEAEAIGYKKIAKELGLDENALVLKMETAKKALEKANYSFVTASGFSDLFNFIPAAAEAVKKMGSESKL